MNDVRNGAGKIEVSVTSGALRALTTLTFEFGRQLKAHAVRLAEAKAFEDGQATATITEDTLQDALVSAARDAGLAVGLHREARDVHQPKAA